MQYRKPWLTVSECLRYVKLNRPRPTPCHAAMLATWVSMPPFRGGHACPGTLELKIVSNRVRRDVAGRAVDAAAVAGRRRGHRSKRWHVTIHQPQPETLASLSAIHRRFVVHAVHVAIDFLCPDPAQADLATAYLRRGVVQKWRRRNQNQLSHVEANTMYWSRNRKARRNIALYGDRPSKAGLGACSHFEMRFTAAAASKRAGLGDLDSLIRGVNAMANSDADIVVMHSTKESM